MKGRAAALTAAFLVVSFVVYLQLFQDQEHNERMRAWMRTNGTSGIWSEILPQGVGRPADHEEQRQIWPTNITTELSDAEQHTNTTIAPPILTDNLNDVRNETLGTQQVFMVSLASRRDKHDAFAVQAMASNITYTYVEGVIGDTVPEKALPYTMHLNAAEIGCWRAHMNIFEEIIEKKIATALIFEDDADWDVAFKQQLVQYARGTRFVTDSEANGSFVPHSPYGENWDVLWIGHCNTKDFADDRKRFVIPHDPTVLPVQYRNEFDKAEMRYWDREGSDYKTRIVYRAKTASCTAAYAISLKGAQKAIYHLSMSPNNQPIDNGMGEMCGQPETNFRCMASNPTLVGISKPAGSTDRGSDVGHAPETAYEEGAAHSERVMYSTRMNLPNLLINNPIMYSEHPEHSDNMHIDDIGRAVGYPYYLKDEEIDELARIDAEWKEKEEQKKQDEERAKLEEEIAKLKEEEEKLSLDAQKFAGTQEQEPEVYEEQDIGSSYEVSDDTLADNAPMPTQISDAYSDPNHSPPYESHESTSGPDFGQVISNDPPEEVDPRNEMAG
ncbi:Procollagen galactosyltransferase 1 [Cyphellophora attinorum]|uniref:Procollagen galactosyltransferase 1 n=1 Tax=Cyphellophora attinorum TaxID=1664694 RepID=A0A0N0NRL2_9EURO|nr:Procollagen galactosyltransferase 1 [Phialophora attinorum]KPI44979.1 Procollagen galactosyltransferase 1 [Phialophora attinorum]